MFYDGALICLWLHMFIWKYLGRWFIRVGFHKRNTLYSVFHTWSDYLSWDFGWAACWLGNDAEKSGSWYMFREQVFRSSVEGSSGSSKILCFQTIVITYCHYLILKILSNFCHCCWIMVMNRPPHIMPEILLVWYPSLWRFDSSLIPEPQHVRRKSY